MGNHENSDFSYHYSRFIVFCSIRHTLSKEQKNCGDTVLDFLLSHKMYEKLILLKKVITL